MANNSGWKDIDLSTNQTPADTGKWKEVAPEAPAPSTVKDRLMDTGAPAPKRGFFDRLSDSYNEATLYGFPGLIGRKYHDWTNTGMDLIKEKYPNASPEELEQMQENLISLTMRDLREQYKKKQEDDPAWRPDESWFDNLISGRWAPLLAGQVAGSPGPESFFLPGSSSLGKIGWQGVAGAVSDAGYQGLDIMDNVQDEYSPVQSIMSGLAGAGFQGVFEGVGKLVNAARSKPGAPAVDEGAYAKEINDVLEAGGDRDAINAVNERYGKEPFGDELDQILKPKDVEAATKDDAIEVLREMQKERPEDAQLIEDIITGKDAGVDNPRYDELAAEARQRLEGQGFQEQWPPVEGLGTSEKFEDLSGKGREGPEVQVYTPGELEQRINTKLVQLEELDAQSAAPMTPPRQEADPFEIQYRTPDEEAIVQDAIQKVSSDWGVPPQDLMNDPAMFNRVQAAIQERGGRGDLLDKEMAPDVGEAPNNIPEPQAEAPSQVSDALVQIRKLANDMHIDASTEGGKYTIGQIGAFHKRISEGLEKGEWKGADLEEAQNIKAFLDEAALMQDQAIRAREAEQGYSEQPPSATVRNPDTSAGNVRPIPANENVGNQLFPTEAERAVVGDNPSNADLEAQRGVRVDPRTGEVEILPRKGIPENQEAFERSWNEETGPSLEADANDEWDAVFQAALKGKEVDTSGTYRGAVRNQRQYNNKVYQAEDFKNAVEAADAHVQKWWEDRINAARESFDEANPVVTDKSGGGDGGQPPREPPSDGGGGSEEPPIDPEELFGRLTERLRTARKAGAEQEAARTQERSKRLQEVAKTRQYTSGEQGYYAEKSKLSGKLPKAEIEPVRDEFSQREIDALFDFVKEKDDLYGNTRAALVKLLGGEIPSAREIQLLSDIFPKPLVKEILKKRSRGQKFLDFAGNALNLPRSLMSTFDLSAPLRQGIFLIGRKEFWKSWGTMFKVFGSERAYKALMDDIKARPTYPLMEEAGLDLTTHGSDLTQREEQFMSQWAEKIPIIGRGVKASERAFTGFLNKLRADTFDSLIKLHEQANKGQAAFSEKELKDMAWFINAATGRGDLGRFSKAGPMLNGLFFSPRLMASRVNLLRPDNYIRLSPIVRQEAIKSLLSFGGIALAVTALAKQGGMEVEGDPRSSDFAKLKTGDTRYDILGGFGQYLTLGARLATNETKKLNGDLEELGKKYGSDTRLDVLLKFLMNKESPVASFVTDYLRGSNAIGEPFEMKTAVAQRFIPLFAQDLTEMVEKQGPVGALMTAPGLFGVGIQDYGKEKSRDMFGRDNTDGTPKSEVDLEIERLGKPLKGELVGKPRKTIYVGKNEYGEAVNRTMTPEEYDNYTYLSGQYILESIKQEMQNPDWKLRSDNDKRDIVRDIVKDMRKQAREDLFTPKTTEETEGWKDL